MLQLNLPGQILVPAKRVNIEVNGAADMDPGSRSELSLQSSQAKSCLSLSLTSNKHNSVLITKEPLGKLPP